MDRHIAGAGRWAVRPLGGNKVQVPRAVARQPGIGAGDGAEASVAAQVAEGTTWWQPSGISSEYAALAWKTTGFPGRSRAGDALRSSLVSLPTALGQKPIDQSEALSHTRQAAAAWVALRDAAPGVPGRAATSSRRRGPGAGGIRLSHQVGERSTPQLALRSLTNWSRSFCRYWSPRVCRRSPA